MQLIPKSFLYVKQWKKKCIEVWFCYTQQQNCLFVVYFLLTPTCTIKLWFCYVIFSQT